MQYFNAIHCDRNTSTSEEKKSVHCHSTDPTITADLRPQADASVRKRMRLQSAHLCCIYLLTNEPCVFDSYA